MEWGMVFCFAGHMRGSRVMDLRGNHQKRTGDDQGMYIICSNENMIITMKDRNAEQRRGAC